MQTVEQFACMWHINRKRVLNYVFGGLGLLGNLEIILDARINQHFLFII